MAGDEKRLNPEAAEFIPNTRLIKLPSRTSSSNTTSLYYSLSSRSPPNSHHHVLSFDQNPNNYFQYHHRHHHYNNYCLPPTPPPSPYLLHHTATTSTPPNHPSLYNNTNPNNYHPTQLHDFLVGRGPGPGKGFRRRGKQRGYYSNRSKSVCRRADNGDGRSLIQANKFNINGQKQYHCCPRHNNNNNIYFSNCSRNNILALPNNKQRHHPVVPVKEDGGNTTVMIRNIPNRFTRDMLMDFLDDHCNLENQKAKQLIIQIHNIDAEAEPIFVSAFDFLYLPMDFKSGVNKGYAFVNFTDPKAAWKFYLSSHNLSWGSFKSNKILQIASARLQGREELERHFESTVFACEGKHEYLPVCFSPARDATNNDCILGLLMEWKGWWTLPPGAVDDCGKVWWRVPPSRMSGSVAVISCSRMGISPWWSLVKQRQLVDGLGWIKACDSMVDEFGFGSEG
ncbi:hypothetical protein Ddye_003989 [Dipteronia dyeriana]|uniref:RRM domain-containing protein n=1 Tax=Dipteronia dyeriana TaxID=168575 RepID=A0AAD9XTR9_9ROSI|nr:hypothetical protein Ddye_003989 [Dipteronia dyeriana]